MYVVAKKSFEILYIFLKLSQHFYSKFQLDFTINIRIINQNYDNNK